MRCWLESHVGEVVVGVDWGVLGERGEEAGVLMSEILLGLRLTQAKGRHHQMVDLVHASRRLLCWSEQEDLSRSLWRLGELGNNV